MNIFELVQVALHLSPLLRWLAEQCMSDKPNMAKAAVMFGMLGFASPCFEQMRMMIFLSLLFLWVPTYKHRYCRVLVTPTEQQPTEDGLPRMEHSSQRVLSALGGLMVFLYLWDGLSGLTSGTLFLIVLPEVVARLPPFPNWKTVLFFLTLIVVSTPIVAIVIGATNFEKGRMELPESYKQVAKHANMPNMLGARPGSVPDHYALIGVRRGADTSDIKRAYRKLSKIYHPDKTAGNLELQEKFVKIVDAMHMLTGKQSDKEAYTKELEDAELQDMVTRALCYVMLSGLWFIGALQWVCNQLGKLIANKVNAAGGDSEEVAPPPPPKPREPLTLSGAYAQLRSIHLPAREGVGGGATCSASVPPRQCLEPLSSGRSAGRHPARRSSVAIVAQGVAAPNRADDAGQRDPEKLVLKVCFPSSAVWSLMGP